MTQMNLFDSIMEILNCKCTSRSFINDCFNELVLTELIEKKV